MKLYAYKLPLQHSITFYDHPLANLGSTWFLGTVEVGEPGKETITQTEWRVACRLKRDDCSDTVEFIIPPNAKDVRATYEIPLPKKTVVREAQPFANTGTHDGGEIIEYKIPPNVKNFKHPTYEIQE